MEHLENVETEITDALPAQPETREQSAGLEERGQWRNQSTPQPYSALND